MACYYSKPAREVFTSSEAYITVTTLIAFAAAINTLAAHVLGKNKTHAALLAASASLLENTVHFTQHRFENDYKKTQLLLTSMRGLSGLIIAMGYSYSTKQSYLSWSNLSLTISPIALFFLAEGYQMLKSSK